MISGVVAAKPEIRFSPAGVAIIRFPLSHRSTQTEAGMVRQALCRIGVVACGTDQAGVTADLVEEGRLVRVTGFLSRESHRNSDSTLVLHAQRIEPLND